MTPDLPNPPVPADIWKPADMTTTPDLPNALLMRIDDALKGRA